jgi:hypothetical protein
MQIANPNSAHNPRYSSRSVGTTNYRHEVSAEEREKFDAALAVITRIKTTFDDWVIIGDAVVTARKYADRVGARKAFHGLLAEQGIMPPLDKATVSHLEKVMARLPEVRKWREKVLTEHQRIAWASPRSVINRCPVFQIEKEKRRAATPRKPTRWESMQEENLALKKEVERHRRSVGDDCSFSRKDGPKAIADVIESALPEHKQCALLVELVKRFGTKKQREVFGLGEDVPCGAEANRSPEAAEMTTASLGGAHVE